MNPGGRGERFKLLELTQPGRELLAAYGVTPVSGHGLGGVAHQWWVHSIATWLSERGFRAAVEDDSRGVRVDLGFAVGKETVAVEVEMTDGARRGKRPEGPVGRLHHRVLSLG